MESGTVGLDLVKYVGQCENEVDPVRCQCGTGPWAALTEGASLLGSLTRRGRSKGNIKTMNSAEKSHILSKKISSKTDTDKIVRS